MRARLCRMRPPSPAMVVALVALFFSLGGAAVAVTAIVPLAKRALVADNARKLDGKTRAQIVAQAAAVPHPTSSAAGLVSVKSRDVVLTGGAKGYFDIDCDSGQRAVSGGIAYQSGDDLWWWDTLPTDDGTGWRIWIDNRAISSATARIYVVCLT